MPNALIQLHQVGQAEIGLVMPSTLGKAFEFPFSETQGQIPALLQLLQSVGEQQLQRCWGTTWSPSGPGTQHPLGMDVAP